MKVRRQKSRVLVCLLVMICGVLLTTFPAEAQRVEIGDRVSIFGDISVPEEISLEGDVISILGGTDIQGKVDGDVVSILGTLNVNNTVSGDVISVLSRSWLGPDADIRGEVIAVGRGVDRDPMANIQGGFQEVTFGRVILPERIRFIHRGLYPLRFITATVIAAAVAVLIISLVPGRVEHMSRVVGRDFWRITFIGFIGHVVALFSIPLFALTIIGLPLSLFVPLLVFLGNVFGFSGVALFVGGRVLDQVDRAQDNRLLTILTGVVILRLARGIPIAGFFVALFIYFVSLGVVLDTKFGSGEPWFNRETKVVKSSDSGKDLNQGETETGPDTPDDRNQPKEDDDREDEG